MSAQPASPLSRSAWTRLPAKDAMERGLCRRRQPAPQPFTGKTEPSAAGRGDPLAPTFRSCEGVAEPAATPRAVRR